MYVCICNPMTEKQVKQVLGLGVDTAAGVFRHFGHKVRCGKCVPYLREMVDDHKQQQAGCNGCGKCHGGEHANEDAPDTVAYGVAAE